MDFFEAVKTRRSVKHYDQQAIMTEQEFEQMMAAVMLSPTSYNIQHWRFVRVKDSVLREAVKKAAWGQEQVADAAELMIICADTQAWQDRPQRYWAQTDTDTQNVILPMIKEFYSGKSQTQRDEAMRSCGMAAQTLMLAAKSLGFDSCPMIGFDSDEVARLIKLPQGHVISMMVAIGKASKDARPRAGQLPMEEVLLENNF